VTRPLGNIYLDASDGLSSHWCQSCKCADGPTQSTISLASRFDNHAQHRSRQCTGTLVIAMYSNPRGVRLVGTGESASKSGIPRPGRASVTPATSFARLIK
jgi:hypothetical protein